ncbi:WD repeat-containing protein 35 isoform X1 [Lates japonicus]|uniref:WD repeat-containing protein 35 isoform X1 n=1 Tax=Lates japonicus TaxID=270547 RepID=A0AAD3NN50_LATJO|nr:WD repeat-containing protein 35 isoform X1 [Lates japonicus]
MTFIKLESLPSLEPEQRQFLPRDLALEIFTKHQEDSTHDGGGKIIQRGRKESYTTPLTRSADPEYQFWMCEAASAYELDSRTPHTAAETSPNLRPDQKLARSNTLARWLSNRLLQFLCP